MAVWLWILGGLLATVGAIVFAAIRYGRRLSREAVLYRALRDLADSAAYYEILEDPVGEAREVLDRFADVGELLPPEDRFAEAEARMRDRMEGDLKREFDRAVLYGKDGGDG